MINSGYDITSASAFLCPIRKRPEFIMLDEYSFFSHNSEKLTPDDSYLNWQMRSAISKNKYPPPNPTLDMKKKNPILFLLSHFNAIKYDDVALSFLLSILPTDYVKLKIESELIFFKMTKDEQIEIDALMKSDTYKKIYAGLVDLGLVNKIPEHLRHRRV
jgi:hypothetical protein